MQTITLLRTGKPAVRFQGNLLGKSELSDDAQTGRWHELALYLRADGVLVLSVAYHTTWTPRESSVFEVYHCADATKVAATLTCIDPTAYVLGHPFGVQGFERKQRELFDGVRRRFAARVTDLLNAADITETVGADSAVSGCSETTTAQSVTNH